MTNTRVYTLWAYTYAFSFIAQPALCILTLANIIPATWLIAAVLIHFAADIATKTMKRMQP